MTPEQFAQAWAAGVKRGAEKYKQKMQALTVSPTQQAAQSAEYWQQRVSSAEAKDKFVSGLNRVDLSEFKRLAVEKGAPNLSRGADSAVQKMARVGQIAIQVGQSVKNAVKGMAKGDESAAVERVRVAMQTAKAGWAGRRA